MTFRDLISLWPSRPKLAAALDLPKVNVDMWYLRDSIPAEHWLQLVETARRQKIGGVTLAKLALLHKQRFAK